jgi:outer membrane lipoprotein-sorting protein
VTARITFTNKLVDSAGLQGSDPLLTGATGRLWASKDRLRLELQASPDRGGGDVQIQVAGDTVSVYDSGSSTVYRGTLPRDNGKPQAIPSVARIQQLLGRLSRHAVVSGATPSNVAGRPAYTVRLSPRTDSGLLGSIQLAWDAANGVPLRAGVYAAGAADPVLELEATDVAFGRVPGSSLSVPVPAGTKTVNLDPRGAAGNGARAKPVVGSAAVQKRLSFVLAAPATLVGLPRQEVRLVEQDGKAGALVTYGRGLGGIAVLQTPASTEQARPSGELSLPKISINGASGEELETPLGSVVRFERAGVSYTVVGSVARAMAEAAARAL